MSILRIFFDNTLAVKRLLVDAIIEARNKQNLEQGQLDEMCMLGGNPSPKCSQFEADPALMTRNVFCRAAFALGLRIDEILQVDLSSKLELVLQDMEANEVRVAGASGGGDPTQITREELAPVYVLLKILEEMDEP